MNQTKRILSSLKLANSLYSTQFSRPQLALYDQVITFLSPPPTTAAFLSSHKIQFFSSKPERTLDLVLFQDSSTQLEQVLSESNLELTHESVMYVLKKLDKSPQKADIFFKWVTEKNGFVPSFAIYGLMLRVYANKDSIKQFWDTLRKMKELGLFLDDTTYQSVLGIFKSLKMGQDATALTQLYKGLLKENEVDDVVKEVVEVVKSMDWGHEIEEKLREMEILMSDDFVLRVLKELKPFPLKALRFFKWVGEGSRFEHNSVTYNGLLRSLCHGDSVEEFWCTIQEMKSVGHDIDLDTYIKMSRRFLKFKMFKDAVELYELMMDGPYKPSAQDCNSLLRAIAGDRNPNMDLVFKVVNKYEALGNSLLKTGYDGIHRSLTSLGRFDEAEKIVEAMRNADTPHLLFPSNPTTTPSDPTTAGELLP